MLLNEKLELFIDREKDVITQEFQSKYPFEQSFIWQAELSEAIYPNHKRSRFTSPIGNPKSIKNLNAIDAQQYYDMHYTPQNISMIVAGGITIETLITLLSQTHFSKDTRGVRNPVAEQLDVIEKPTNTGKVESMQDYGGLKIDHTRYIQTWVLPGTLSRYTLNVFSSMLSKLLIDEIRHTRALTYCISTDYFFTGDSFEFSVDLKTKTGTGEKARTIVAEKIASLPQQLDVFNHKFNLIFESMKLIDQSIRNTMNDVSSDLRQRQNIETLSTVENEFKLVKFEDLKIVSDLLNPDRSYTHIVNP